MSTIDYRGYTGTDATVYLYYHYIPKQAPTVVAAVVFLVLGFVKLGITIKTKAWFMLIVALTAFLEVGGFIFRIAVLHQPTIGNVAITQALLIISPIFLALVDYEAMGKLMKLGQGTGSLRPGLVAKLFFSSDILAHSSWRCWNGSKADSHSSEVVSESADRWGGIAAVLLLHVHYYDGVGAPETQVRLEGCGRTQEGLDLHVLHHCHIVHSVYLPLS